VPGSCRDHNSKWSGLLEWENENALVIQPTFSQKLIATPKDLDVGAARRLPVGEPAFNLDGVVAPNKCLRIEMMGLRKTRTRPEQQVSQDEG
jgi:hypothetical protein